MTYPSRKRKAPTAGETRKGLCPFCGPADPSPCVECNGTHVIEFSPTFSLEEEEQLRVLATEGKSWNEIGIRLSRPAAVIRSRASLLWIRGPPEPDSYVVLRPVIPRN